MVAYVPERASLAGLSAVLAEFAVVFVVTFLVLGGVAAAMAFGKTPVYQPSIDDVQAILTRLLEGELNEHEWQFFCDMPIRLNPELEEVRLQCWEIQQQHPLRARADKARLKEEGLIKARHILAKLEQSGSKTF